MKTNARFDHLAALICGKYSDPQKVAEVVSAIGKTLPDFPEYFPAHYAFYCAGKSPYSSERKGFVYFLRSKEGNIKIGYSDDNVAGRYRSHARQSDGPLETILVMRGCYADETALHDMYEQHRINGEWYNGTGIVEESIAAMSMFLSENPTSTVAEAIQEGKWSLFFYRKEAECYKSLFRQFLS